MTARERLESGGKKKLLALDGGGIRGALTIEVLAELERMLRRELGNDELVLGDYFDFVGGTSTGAILAASISFGMSTAELRRFYEASGPLMFEKAPWWQRFQYKYKRRHLAEQLRTTFGEDTQLGSDKLRTMLMMVMRNAHTDSPWPVSNNPNAKYNNPARGDNNLEIPLWQLIRASAAAPVYFPPEEITVGENDFLFVDGGLTMFNNPAFQMFLMATIPAFKVQWPTGEDQMLIVSVGTGHAPDANKDLDASDMNLLYNAGSIPSALMAAALHEQDTLCRVFGNCLVGGDIDREVKDLKGTDSPGGNENLFTYMRYDAKLTWEGLDALGLPSILPRQVQALDSTEFIKELQYVGQAVSLSVDSEHFRGFLEA